MTVYQHCQYGCHLDLILSQAVPRQIHRATSRADGRMLAGSDPRAPSSSSSSCGLGLALALEQAVEPESEPLKAFGEFPGSSA